MYRSGFSGARISAHFKKERTWAYKILKKSNEKMKNNSECAQKHAIDDGFFDELHERSAYWLGFIAADGNIHENLLQIDLAIKDKPHLEKFKQDLKSSHLVLERWTPYHQCRFAVNNRKMVEALRNLGITEQKSLTALPLRHSSPEIMRHYWRGVVDGDGSLYESGKKPHLTLTGSQAMCSAFLEWCKQYVLTRTTVKRGHGDCWSLGFSGGNIVPALTSRLYCDSRVYLDRKHRQAMRWQLQPKSWLAPAVI